MLVFLIYATLCAGALARRDGAPQAACGDMTPAHGAIQDGENPYSLDVVEETCPSGDEPCFAVTISGESDFRGFFIQARYLTDNDTLSEDQTPVGFFEILDEEYVRFQDCLSDSEFDSVTHVNRTDKAEVSAYFNPDGADLDGLFMVATVVEQYLVVWYDIRTAVPTLNTFM